MENAGHRGWHSRGYLPHFDGPFTVQSVTFRLFDSLPAEAITRWKDELDCQGGYNPDDPRWVELHRRISTFEDSGRGSCFLGKPEIAAIVEGALLHFDDERYRLSAWCVMPNHVHILIEPLPGQRLDRIVHSWKSYTANRANESLRRSGEFWMADYYDRHIRNSAHFSAAVEYIENNPVKARLARSPGDWRFSSYRRRKIR